MSVERALNIKVIICIEPYRDSRESAGGEEACQALTHCRTPSVWIDVKDLPSAVDDHPELHHFVCTKQPVDVRKGFRICNVRSCSRTAAVLIESGKICDRHGHICQRAISHRNAFYFAGAIAFPAPAKQTAHIRVGLFYSETECIHAVDVDDRVRRPGINHQGSSPIVNGHRNKQVIAEASFKFCAGEALLGKKTSQRAAGLLWLSAKRRQL